MKSLFSQTCGLGLRRSLGIVIFLTIFHLTNSAFPTEVVRSQEEGSSWTEPLPNRSQTILEGPRAKLDPDDAQLSVPDIISKNGYPVEVHKVITSDGYILTLHRIPYGKKTSNGSSLATSNGKRPVVFLQHGLFGDSFHWIMNTEEKALAYMLANDGYDVWLGNSRGNTYSRNHIKLSPKQKEFWNFSFHEMGIYDLPSAFDYILNCTSKPDLSYIGHSMGTTMFWITMSQRPEYNSKVKVMMALAPVAAGRNMKSPISHLAPISRQLEKIFDFLGVHEFLPSNKLMELLGKSLCHEQSKVQILCTNVLFLVMGYSWEQLNKTAIPIIMGHTPAGGSARTLVHFAQGINSGRFRQFDYGWKRNLVVYGRRVPPEYDLSKIKVPVSILWSLNDWLAVPKDVQIIQDKLPTLVRSQKVELDSFNHLDFILGIGSDTLVNRPVMEVLKSYYHINPNPQYNYPVIHI